MNNVFPAPTSLAAGVALAALIAAAPATAQSIDYAQLEAMFGEPVTTSATGAPQRASDVPAAMTIITGEDIRRTGAISLAEALRGYAGIDVNHFTGQQYDVAIRGGNQPFNPSVLVMVNGRQVYLDYYSLTSWSNLGIELSEIRQIEIVKGPVSALYGFNASQGAINIITYNPAHDRVNAVSAQIGSDGERVVSGVASLALGKRGGVRVSGGYAEEDEFVPASIYKDITPHRENAAVDADYALTDIVDARLNYSYSRSRQLMVTAGFIPSQQDIRTSGVQGILSADTGIGIVEAGIVYNDVTSDGQPNVGNVEHLVLNTRTFIGHVQDIFKPGPRDTVRATLEYRHNALSIAPDRIGRISYQVYSGGLMWNHDLSDAVTLNLAGRVDHLALAQAGAIDPQFGLTNRDFDRALTAWSGNAGLVIRADGASTVRVQLARGVQVPSLASFGLAFEQTAPGIVARVVGNPGLDPTIVESAELGYTHNLARISGALSVSLFYARTKDILTFHQSNISFDPNANMILLDARFDNIGSFDSYGVEAMAKGRFSPALKWQIDYTFDAVRVDFPASIDAADRPFEELTPRHKLGVKLGYEKGRFTLDGRALLRSRVTYPANGRVSGWAVGFDGRAAWRLAKGAEIFVVGEDLTSSRYIDNGAARDDIRARVGVSLAF